MKNKKRKKIIKKRMWGIVGYYNKKGRLEIYKNIYGEPILHCHRNGVLLEDKNRERFVSVEVIFYV